MLLAALAVLVSTPARAADDGVPSFNDRGDDEKAFVSKVGTAIVKAARMAPKKIELDTYKFEEVKDKKDRKNLEITMKWVGLVNDKRISTIVVKIDTSDAKKWEVLNVEYKDDGMGKPGAAKIQELIKKFNR
jgi:hypothetical protein